MKIMNVTNTLKLPLLILLFSFNGFAKDRKSIRFDGVIEKNQEIFYELEISVRRRVDRLREIREGFIEENRYERKKMWKMIKENKLLLGIIRDFFMANIDEVEKEGVEALNREKLLVRNEILGKYKKWIEKTKNRIESFILEEEGEIEKLRRLTIQFDSQFRDTKSIKN